MKTIRGKLFLSIGVLITLLFVVNYFLPKFFIVKDTSGTAKVLVEKFEDMEERLHNLIGIWVSHYFIHDANQLDNFAKILNTNVLLSEKIEQESLLSMGAQLIAIHPSLAYVQLDNKVAIAPEDVTLYQPLWYPLENNKIALYFPTHQPSYYVATPLYSENKEGEYYSLEESSQSFNKSEFRKFEDIILPINFNDSSKEFYDFLSREENLLIIKAQLIREMVDQKKEQALFVMDAKKERGYALFPEMLFPPPMDIGIEESPTKWSELSLLKRGEKLDLMRVVQIDERKIYMALSFSRMAGEISKTLNKPIVLSDGKSLSLLFQPEQPPVVLTEKQLLPSKEQFEWKGVPYKPYVIDLKKLKITLLTPSAEVKAIPSEIARLGQKLEDRISINLLVSGIIGLCVALFILSRLSKKITDPIAKLAHAAEKIGAGEYEGVDIPEVKGRKDEVATFSYSFKKMAAALADREKMHGVLNKVVSTEIASEILKGSVELGGEERRVTLLFSDIRNFTHLSNSLHPKEVIEMLNDYMTTMCHEVDKTQGVVDKFVGDEIIALYGAPVTLEHHADHAVQAAVAMMTSLKAWNKKRIQLGKVELSIGIGLHTGVVCSGNMGAANRLNYTVIGANVNLASRLCTAAKPMQILLSRETKEALTKTYPIKEVAPISVKGFDMPLEVFEIIH